ncbi:hypothetical protein SAMN04244553_6251 [Nocardia amikacinitolerans]|uniref:Excreted virulence factor EspC, type VII ESX diderm n=1 Tax=Nocardia amikacinitolerans TaxID=756689 RepID=A0A285LWC1_9NOCA|nr:hypothetical protein [Nocardia amikacinitolerans]SNY89244.1 hypothetical protein SAMN04244553_6251 [Nocardia amikacinitolerans]
MTENQAPRPMTNMLTAAREGNLSVVMKPEDFIYIDRDCEFFKLAIQQIQGIMDAVSRQPHWGLGEGNDKMVSGGTVVGRFKTKANGAEDGNSVWKIMEQHYQIVEDIQEVHRLVRERMMQADSNFAAEFNRLNETLPERPPEGQVLGPFILPDGSTK